MAEQTTLEKLLEQQKEIQRKIKEEQKALVRKTKAVLDRKAMIVGHAILEAMQDNPATVTQLKPLLDRHVKSSKDRALLELSLPEKKKREIPENPVTPT